MFKLCFKSIHVTIYHVFWACMYMYMHDTAYLEHMQVYSRLYLHTWFLLYVLCMLNSFIVGMTR